MPSSLFLKQTINNGRWRQAGEDGAGQKWVEIPPWGRAGGGNAAHDGKVNRVSQGRGSQAYPGSLAPVVELVVLLVEAVFAHLVVEGLARQAEGLLYLFQSPPVLA